jgi:cysteine desulfurase
MIKSKNLRKEVVIFLTNMKNHIIYADHAATTALSVTARSAMSPFLEQQYGNPSTRYSLAREPRNAVVEARKTIAKLIGAKPEEIFFTSCGTESNNWAIKGTAFHYIGQHKRIITSCIEHHAVLHSCTFLKKLGFEVVCLPVDYEGLVNVQSLLKALTENTVLVAIMLANNEIGTIETIKDLSLVAHEHNVLFHTDAVQAIGHIPVNVEELGVDMLSASAHKFGGPKGVGFLYKKSGVEVEPFMSGGGQEMQQRAGTENVASIVGMAAALKESICEMNINTIHLNNLVEQFKERMKVSKLDYIYNGSENRIPGSISISFKAGDGEMLLHRLDLKGIAVSTGSACNSKYVELSHVLRAIDISADYAKGTIRITLGADNTVGDIYYIVQSLTSILKK